MREEGARGIGLLDDVEPDRQRIAIGRRLPVLQHHREPGQFGQTRGDGRRERRGQRVVLGGVGCDRDRQDGEAGRIGHARARVLALPARPDRGEGDQGRDQQADEKRGDLRLPRERGRDRRLLKPHGRLDDRAERDAGPIRAFGNADTHRVRTALARIVVVERPPQPPHLRPGDAVVLAVEIRPAPQRFGGDGEAFDPVAAPGQFLLDDEGEQRRKALAATQRARPHYRSTASRIAMSWLRPTGLFMPNRPAVPPVRRPCPHLPARACRPLQNPPTSLARIL